MTRAFHAWAGVIPRTVCQPSVELSESKARCAALTDSIHTLELHRCAQPALIVAASLSVMILTFISLCRKSQNMMRAKKFPSTLSLICIY